MIYVKPAGGHKSTSDIGEIPTWINLVLTPWTPTLPAPLHVLSSNCLWNIFALRELSLQVSSMSCIRMCLGAVEGELPLACFEDFGTIPTPTLKFPVKIWEGSRGHARKGHREKSTLQTPWKYPENTLKTPWKDPEKTLQTPWKYPQTPETPLKTPWKYPENTLKFMTFNTLPLCLCGYALCTLPNFTTVTDVSYYQLHTPSAQNTPR